MAPAKPTIEHTVDRTPEYEKFIEELRAFHEKRGTNFDPEPKMGNTTVDLLKLFKYIVAHGGYDKVSEEKLMWRKMCEGLGLMRHNAPADAYTLKQIFYKNLAAYEIKTIHNKEPPPPEILEFTTAKGGSLLTRTLETYQVKNKQQPAEREGSNTEEGTPSRENQSAPTSTRASRGLREAPPPRVIFQPDTGPSRTRHSSNQHHNQQHSSNSGSNSQNQSQNQGQASSQTHSGTATPSHQGHPHATRGNASHTYNPPGPDAMNPVLQSYQPPPIQQVPLRIVDTPASNPELFARKQRQLRYPQPSAPNPGALVRATLGATALEGPNIYERCLLALRSSLRAEQAFALNHLVKISYERGDKYKFSQFSGLAEGLTEFALGVTKLFYGVEMFISHDFDLDCDDPTALDGINGTDDLDRRLAEVKKVNPDIQDSIQPAEFADQLTLINEAVLTIRNMVMLPDNAWFLSEYPPVKDLLVIILHLPEMDMLVELKHLALEIAEQLTPYMLLSESDPLYFIMMRTLERSEDRGMILSALRALGRIAMQHPTETNKLKGVGQHPNILPKMASWLLLNDDELLDACLDFLYQYTAEPDNIDLMLRTINVDHVVAHLVRLLSHGAKRSQREIVLKAAQVAYEAAPEQILALPKDLQERLLAMEEPDRCQAWLRCLFEEDPGSHVTQIAIWQAYNGAFAEALKMQGRPMIGAQEYIKNISNVYQSGGAQVVREQGPTGEIQKFIMSGIRPRSRPIALDGRSYLKCHWKYDGPTPPGIPVPQHCGSWHLTAETMWRHILVDHLREPITSDGKFQNREAAFSCHWDGCTKYRTPTKQRLAQLMAHVKTHLRAEEAQQHKMSQLTGPNDPNQPLTASPTVSKRHPPHQPHASRQGRVIRPATTITITYEETASARDERNPNAPPQAAGIPLSAVLILRNIARNVPHTNLEREERERAAEAAGQGEQQAQVVVSNDREKEIDDDAGSRIKAIWNERLFRPVLPRLWEVFTENRLLAPYVASLFSLLERDDRDYSSEGYFF
ncbi:putative chromatin structure-remodeling complex protein [Thermochaetoides thermophila DSM 1495]|uniref:Putative chromatin structure-remodeling complex protein n=1 Tax=Chaetomium thermophilum (strain DSM 1495 / CBS 144.50 / IMI 039719) TaxID=759272 RepID=G0S909_CHATD|nr:putative chromatin structure-remodeling complex protein [Thermochaetoides thermophila DSM 1495]EGS19920.1 putative chromatin structure-remodeling complex protein [Thermochaetoides thermophila DSM 1495]